MRIVISQKTLIGALKKVAKAVPPKPSLPILTNFRFHLESGILRILGTDLNVYIEAACKPDSYEGEGCFMLPYTFYKAIEKMSGLITIVVNGSTLDVNGLTIDVDNIDDYPTAPKPENTNTVVFRGVGVGSALKQAVDIADVKSVRFQAASIWINSFYGFGYMVATDLSCLLEQYYESDGDGSFMLPGEAVKRIASIIPPDLCELKMKSDGKSVWIDFESFVFCCILNEGVAPDYRQIAPDRDLKKALLDSTALSKVIDLLGATGEKHFDLSDKGVISGSQGFNIGVEGEIVDARFEISRFQKILKAFAGTIEITSASDERAFILKSENKWAVIMPVRK